MRRSEFPVSVRKAAYARANGICECGCGQPFTNHPKERPHFDHDLADFLGGNNDLENCKVLRMSCHQEKTAAKDMGMIKKVRRGQKDRANLKANKQKMSYRRFNGEPVWK